MAGTLSVQKIQGLATSATPTTVEIASGHTLHQPGATLQTVSFTSQSSNSTTSTSFVQIGDTLSITPKFATSKILITMYYVMRHVGNTYSVAAAIGRGTANNNLANIQGIVRHPNFNSYTSSTSHTNQHQLTIVYLDSPATTSTRHYGLMAHVNNGTATLNPNSTSSPEDCHTITLQEIAQ